MSRRERGTDPDATLPQAHRYHDDPIDDDDTLDADESNTFTIRPGDDEAGSDEEYLNGQKKSSISKYIPNSVRRWSKAIANWTKGPDPPRTYHIGPGIFPEFQEMPLHLVERHLPKRKHRIAALLALYFAWLLCFVLVLSKSAFASDIPGYGSPVRVSCGARYWYEQTNP